MRGSARLEDFRWKLVYGWHGAQALISSREPGSRRIASLISWRGVWYVVHFGGVVRPAVGLVDDPESGSGYPGPAGGC